MVISANSKSNFDFLAWKITNIVTFLHYPTTALLGLANLMLFSCVCCTLRHANVDLDLHEAVLKWYIAVGGTSNIGHPGLYEPSATCTEYFLYFFSAI